MNQEDAAGNHPSATVTVDIDLAIVSVGIPQLCT